MTLRGNAAGRSSECKYQELARSWRRRNRRLFATVALVCGGVLVVSFALAQLWPAYGWLLGVFGGAALAFWLVARFSPPGWIENWQVGAWGEQATAKVLRELERDGWVVLHDLRASRGNVDHIVVGTAGVFLLDSKRLGGSVAGDATGVTVRRLDDRT